MLVAANARPVQAFPGTKTRAELSEVIEVIGGEEFASRMLSFLGTVAGADHCAIYQLTGPRLDEIGIAGVATAQSRQRTETIRYEIRRQLNEVCPWDCRVDFGHLRGAEPAGLADAPDRERQSILISGRKAEAAYCLRILRSGQSDGAFDASVERLREIAQILISLTAKHADLVEKKPNLTPALCSLREIQDCISEATALSRREAEVCARVLYGMTSYGIALDLGIGKESVMTYRKRAYARLGIGSQRELLMWYLARWSEARGGEDADPQTPAKAVSGTLRPTTDIVARDNRDVGGVQLTGTMGTMATAGNEEEEEARGPAPDDGGLVGRQSNILQLDLRGTLSAAAGGAAMATGVGSKPPHPVATVLPLCPAPTRRQENSPSR